MSEPLLEASTPERVTQTLAFMGRHQLWHIVSRNSRATSCRDAASRRVRLGTTGIPLHDELKSLCVAVYRNGSRRTALLHCRAGARFDLDAAARVLDANRPLARLSAEELSYRHQAEYGTVNPFSEPGGFIQVFDENVCARYSPPHTMMTNAGHHTWAVEFRPDAVIEALRMDTEVQVAPIVRGATRTHELPSFGIITGNGPESGMALWRHINDAVYRHLAESNRLYGDLSYPRVVVHSVPEMGLSMELAQRGEEVWEIIRDAIDSLCQSRTRYIALACNTTQYFADRIRAHTEPRGTTFVSMAEVVMDYIRQHRLTDLTIIGIPVVADLGEYSAYRPLRELGVQPVHERARPHLQELGYLVKKLGLGEKDTRPLNKLQHVMNAGVSTKNVLIALTEISVLLERFPKLVDRIAGRTLIDPLKLYGESLARLYLDALPSDDDDEDDHWEAP